MQGEKFISSQIAAYCKARHCRMMVGTFVQNQNGVYLSLNKQTPPEPKDFTSCKTNENGGFNCFISVSDYYNKNITGGIEPFVKSN